MKKTLVSPPDSLTVHPLLAILPRYGTTEKLEGLRSSLFARYENVKAAKASARGAESQRKAQNEQAMLKIVLDWIRMVEGG